MNSRRHRRALIETFESRILYSADPGPAGIVAAVLAGSAHPGDGTTAIQQGGAELVFVDARVPDVQQLLDDLSAQQQAGRPIEVVVVGSDEDGIGVIGAALAGRSDVSAVHVIGHGASGVAQLGASELDAESVFQRAGEIAGWGDALSADADLLLYGCDVGDGEAGQSLVATLAQLTGADVAASDDPTGSALLGGDWDLEVRTGAIEATPFASANLQVEWSGVLALTAQGSETKVNTTVSGTQTENWSTKTVAMDANGNYVVIWMDGSGAAGDTGQGIYGQRYNASGVAQGAQFHVNTYTTDNQRNPAVAMDANGNFVVVWESNSQDGSSYGIYAQRYNSSGVAQGSEFRVNTTTTYDQIEASVAMDANGNFVVAWQSWSQDLVNTNGIYAQRYNSSGVAQGSEFLVNTYTTESQTEPSVAMDAAGNFVIAWQSFGQDGDNEGIYAKRYNSSGVVQGSEFHVSTYTTSNQDLPVVAMDSTGNFVVVWESNQDGSGNGIYGQRYNSSGAAQGGEFRINTTTADQQQNPVVAMLAGGAFVVTWQSTAQDGSFDGVYMRHYDSSGTALTAETLVNTTTTDYQDVPSIAADEKGHLVVVWHGNGPGDTDGVFMQRYQYAAAPVLTLTGYSGTYVENAGVIYDAGATVTDADTTTFTGGQLIYQITANGTASDELGIRNQGTGVGQIGLSGTNVTYGGTTIGTYSGSFGNGSTPLVVTFNSNASVAAVQALVRNVTYRNTSENPSTATRTISLTVSDGTGMTSAPAVVSMAVTAVNDAPTVTSAASASVAENTTVVMTVTSSDVDGGTPVYSISGGADAAKFTINSSTGALSFVSAPDYEAPTDSDANNVYNVTVQVSDGAGGTANQAIAVTVTDVSSALVVTTTADTNDTGLGSSFTAEQLNASKGTDGKISLREAIIAANTTAGTDTISFNITDALVSGTHTIKPTTALPTLTGAVIIDGTTEPDYVVGRPVIEIDGSLTGSGVHGLVLGAGAGGSTIRGLAINSFNSGNGYGLYLMAGADNNLIEGNIVGLDADGTTAVPTMSNFGVYVASSGNTIGGTTAAARNVLSNNVNAGVALYGSNNVVIGNYIGTDATGTLARGNGNDGADVYGGANNRVGGTTAAERNIISGNLRNGIEVSTGLTGTLIQGNYIGTDVTGTLSLGNNYGGIWVGSSSTGVTIGGTAAGAGNTIVNNPTGGIYTDTSSVSFSLLGNTFYNNANLAIDLKNDGVTANDAGDADTGPNSLQNFPVITTARINGSGNLALVGTLASSANSYYRIEFFANATQDASGYGEGQRYLGYVNVATNGSGNASFNTVLAVSMAVGESVTATATKSNAAYSSYTDTSEFAANVLVSANQLPVVTTTGSTLAYTENGAATAVDGALTVTDADSPNLTSATVSITSGFASGQDTLAFTDQSGITGSWNAVTGVLTLSGSATVANYQSALRSVTYVNTSEQPATATRTVSFAVNDGLGTSATATRNISVASVNDAPSFNAADYTVTTAPGAAADRGYATLVQGDGKILVAGYSSNGSNLDFLLMRYNVDGTLDTSFGGGDGMVTTAIGSGDDEAHAVALQSDGRILVAGFTQNGLHRDFALVRYLADGTLDTSFGGGDGIVTTDLGGGSGDEAWSMVVQTDGRIVLGGTSASNFALVRYNTDGSVDTSFSGDGMVSVDIAGGSSDNGYGLALQSDGKLVQSGSGVVGGAQDFALVRYNTDGSVDTGFGGGDGIVTTAIGASFDIAQSVAIQSDGKIVVGGYFSNGSNNDIAVVRYTSAGAIDTGFGGGDGITTVDFGGHDASWGLTLQSDARIVVVGGASSTDLAAVRLLSDGSLDTSFSGDGKLTAHLGTSSFLYSAAIGADGRVVATGYSNTTTDDALLVRFSSDGQYDTRANPAATSLGGSASYTENGSAVVIDSSVRIFDAELNPADSYAGATLTLARSGGANAQDVFSASGNLGTLTQGGNLLLSGVNVGTVTTNSSGTLLLTFNASATQVRINEVMSAIAYANSSDAPPASVTLGWTFSDGNTGGQGSGGAKTATGTSTINITAVNDAPTVTSAASASVAENTTAVMTVTSSDVDGGTPVYSISGGLDAAKFSINSSTGALSFVSPPNYEAPTDSGANNVYNVTVQVSDGAGGSANQAIAVTVTDVSSALVVTTTADTNDTGLGASFTAEQLNASKGTDGKISLREAIIAANTTAGADTISFSIAGSGPHTIVLASALPTLTDAVTIDGSTEPDYASAPVVVLDGNATVNEGLTIEASNSTVRGLVINNFAARGVLVTNGAANTVIAGNYIGTDATGLVARGNGSWGIDLISAGSGTVIGGTTALDRNVIAGNVGQGGIAINGTQGATVSGNYIGVGADGSTALGNAAGILALGDTTGTRIGGTTAGAGNVIANNTGEGVMLWSATSHAAILGNSFYNNTGQAIDLGWNGTVDANDAGDADTGPNQLQNFPVISSAITNGATQIIIAGSLNSEASSYYRIEFYANPAADSNGYGEGRTYLGSTNVTTDGSGNAAFNVTLSAVVAGGASISATATRSDASFSSFTYTSEFAANVTAQLSNSAPAGINGSVNVTEDTTYTFALTDFGYTDANSNALLQIWIDTLPAAGTLRLSGSTFAAGTAILASDISAGHLTYQPVANSNTSTSLTFRVQDDGGTVNGGQDTDASANTLTINITAVNDAPTITSGATANVAENTTAVLTVSSSDVDGGTPVYSISGGVDAAKFSINSSTGALSFATAPDYESPTDSGADNVYDVTVQAADGAGGTASQAIAVTVTNVNEAPAVTITPATYAATEQTTLILSGTGLSIADVDAGAATLRATLSVISGTLSVGVGTTGVTLVWGSGSASVVLEGSQAQLNDLLAGNAGGTINYIFDGDAPPATDTLSLNVNDLGSTGSGGAASGADSATINLTAVNDAPVNTMPGAQATSVNTALTFGTATGNPIAISDADAASATLQVSLTITNGTFTLSSTSGLSFTTGDGTGDAALTFTGTVAAINAALDGASFIPTTAYSGDAAIAILTSDLGNTGGGALTDSDTIHIQVGASRFQEGVGGYTGTQDTYVQDNTPSTAYGSDITVWVDDGAPQSQGLLRFDNLFGNGVGQIPFGATITSASLSFYVTHHDAADTVYLHRMFSAWTEASTWNSLGSGIQTNNTEASTTATLSFSAGVSGWNTLTGLESTVQAWADGATNNGWAFLTINPGADNWTYASSEYATVSLRPYLVINYEAPIAPVITSNGGGASASVSIAENTSAVTTVTATDADSTASELSYSIVGGADAARFTINSTTGALSFLAAPNYESPTDAGGNNVYDVTVQVSDGFLTDTQAIAVTVTPVNDNTPAITSSASANVAENSTAVMTVTATDADLPAQTLTYSIVGGADAAKFSINASTGALSFVTAPDFEVPTDAGGNNVYDVTVQVSDGTLTSTQAIAVTVTPVNDNTPAITSGATAGVAENSTAVMTVTATDADLPAQTLSYSIVGGADAAKFSINASTGALSFVTAPDYEAPTDAGGNNVYDVTIRVSDGTLTSTQAIAVTVTPVNDNTPAITSSAGANVAENSTAVMTVTATDADLPAQTLSYSIVGGADAAKFAINSTTGALSFVTAQNYESPTDAGGNNIYDVTVQVSDGTLTSTQAIAVTVTPVNDNIPTITSSATASVAENTTTVLTVTATDADLPAQTLSYSIVGGADAAKFSINSTTGALSFVTAPDYEAPADSGGNNVYDVTVQVSDGTLSSTQAIAVTVTPVNDNTPAITSSAIASVAENSTAVMTVTATDADLPAQTLSYSIVGGADAAKFSINASTGALSFLAAPDFEAQTDAGGNNVYDVTVQVSDGSLTSTQAIAVTVTPANDNTPAITSSATASVAENTTAVMTVTATDADLPAQTLSYSIVGGADAAKFSINSTTGALSFVTAPDYEFPTDAGADNVYDVTVQVSDGSLTSTQAIAVTVTPVNDNTPAITSSATASVAENTTAVMTVTATDTDLPAQTLSYAIVGGADAAKFSINASTGALSFVTAPDYEAPTDAGGNNVYDVTVQVSDGFLTDTQAIAVTVTPVSDNTPTIISSAAASVAENTTAVMTVTATDADLPAQTLSYSIVGGADAAKFSINASTGALSFVTAPDYEAPTDAGVDNIYDVTVQVSDGTLTSTQAIAVTVTPVNDNTPAITSGASASVAENSTAVLTVTATDADLPVQTLSYSIVGGADAAKFSINSTTGALSFVTAPDYEAPTDAGANNVYDVTVQVSDGTLTSTQAIAVTVTPVNDNTPAITSSATASVAENTTAVMTVTATDADLPAQTLSYSIVGGADAAKFSINSSTGALSFVTAPDFEVPTDAGGNNIYDVTVQVSDGTLTSTQAIAVTVTPVNDNTPTITSSATASVAENTTAVMTVTATDADLPAQTLSYSIVGGADAAKFAINASTGALSFVTAPDYEAPTDVGADNTYDVTVQVSDGTLTSTQAIAVTVTPVNDNTPVITSGATASVAENSTVVLTVTATDADLPAQTLSYSIVGGADAAKFSINASTGALSFVTAPDYEAPIDSGADNVYDVTVQVSDGTLTSTQAIAVTVTPVNDNTPAITSSATASVAENSTAVLTITATDADLPAQTFSYSIVGGADAAKLSINSSTGALSFVTAPDYESPTDAGGNNVYDVTVQVSDGTLTSTQAIAVTVTPVNDNTPAITSSATANVAENTTTVLTVTATDADLPAQMLSYSIVGGADAAKFSINSSTGALSFVTAPDFEAPTDSGADNVYEVTVQVSDGTLSSTQAIAVMVTPANDNTPAITSSATASVAENSTAVLTVTATDADLPAQTLSYSIFGGADAAKFSINATTGALSFVTAPDYESPTDAGGNNVYDVTVQVSDGSLTSTHAIAVTVTPVNDNTPAITSSATASVAENTTAVLTVTATDADLPAQTLSYSIVGGADAAKFSINASTGALSFVTAPDYESPTDSGSNNTYDVTVQVSDGTLTSTQAIAVTVTPANDNTPAITSSATASVAENSTAVMTVTATDADLPVQTLSYSIVGGSDAAKFSINSTTGALSFVTAPDFEAPTDAAADNTYDITVQASDGTRSVTMALAVSVTNRNEMPTGSDGRISLAEDATHVFALADFGFADPLDAPANALAAVQIVAGPARGSLTLDGAAVADGQWITAADIAAGRLRFAAAADENGADYAAIEFRVRDDGGRFDGGVDTEAGSHTLAIDVSPVNDAPVAMGEGYTLDEDTPLVVPGAGVLANDSDIDGDPLSARLVSGPAHGSLTLAADGSFIYTPDANWSGADGFIYRAVDGRAESAPVAVSLVVRPVNDAPTMVRADLQLIQGGSTVLKADAVSAADVDSATGDVVFIVDSARHGHFELVSAPGVAIGQFSYAALAAGNVVFVHESIVDLPVVTLHPTDGLADGAPMAASVGYSSTSVLVPPGGSGGTEPPAVVVPPAVTVPTTTTPATTTPKTPDATKPAAPAAPVVSRADAAAEQGGEAGVVVVRTAAGGEGSEPHVRRFSAENSLVKFGGARVTLTLGAGTEGPLMEFLLGANTAAQGSTGSAAARQATAEKAGVPPLGDDAYTDVRLVLNAVELSGIALSVGAVWWASRAGGLIASLLMAAPAWRSLDPLPVLGPQDEEEGDWGELMDDEMTRDEEGAEDVFGEQGGGGFRG